MIRWTGLGGKSEGAVGVGMTNELKRYWRSGAIVPKYSRTLSRAIVLVALSMLVWLPFTRSGAQPVGHVLDTAGKGAAQLTSQDRSDTSMAPVLTRGGAIPAEPISPVLTDALTAGDIYAKLEAISKKLDGFSITEQKLDDVEAAIQQVQQILHDPGAAETPSRSESPRRDFWTITMLGTAAVLSIIALTVLRILVNERRSKRAEIRSFTPSSVSTNPVELLSPKLEDQSKRTEELARMLGQLSTTVQRLAADLKNLPALIVNSIIPAGVLEASMEPVSVRHKPLSTTIDASSRRDLPVSTQERDIGTGFSSFSKPPRGSVSQLDAQVASVLSDFREIASDDNKTPSFLDRWRPQSVILANFDQRVRESGISPELVVRKSQIGNNDEHFWFISPTSSQMGFILPARRLLLHRSVLRGEGAATLFRQIFEINSSATFNVEHPAFAVVEGERVRIIQQGTIALPY